ncbi:hypothetical protein BDQ17DRAFT_1326065 [Cyathus striatus]|nr:hypothetical protein BDQ17DRAFT_1326065 [Cyathus striatus]
MDELEDFLGLLEQMFEISEVSGDKEKIQWAIAYVGSSERKDWKSFDESKGNSWESFKKRIFIEYPEADSTKGSLEHLRSICREYRGISRLDETRLRAFIRKFNSEYKKLTDVSSIITNREAVEYFQGALDDEFQEALDMRLLMVKKVEAVAPATTATTGSTTTTTTSTSNKIVRKEDPYEIKEVMDTALSITMDRTLRKAAEINVNQRATSSSYESIPDHTIKKEFVSLKEGIQKEVSSIAQEVNAMKDSWKTTEKLMKNYFEGVQSEGTSLNRTNRAMNAPLTTQNRQCFYCDQLGHGWLQCPVKDRDIANGRVIIKDQNKLYFGDGQSMPRGNGPIKDKVERHYSAQVNMYDLMPEFPPGVLDLSSANSSNDVGYSLYVNAIKDNRDAQLEAKDKELERQERDLHEMRQKVIQLNQRNNYVNIPSTVSQPAATSETSLLLAELSKLRDELNNLKKDQFVQTRSSSKLDSQQDF